MELPHIPGELSQRESQLAALSILKKIDAICQAEHIRYWAMYGTLIGAIRHRGFIPWDDDIDIAMPRPDYDRFLAYFREHSDELRPLVALHGNGERKLAFLLTRVSDTTYKMIGEYGDDVPELGVFVDVYPYDGAGASKAQALDRLRKCQELNRQYARANNSISSNRASGGPKRLLKSLRAKALGDPRPYAEKLHAVATELDFDQADYVSCLEWPAGAEKVWRRELCKDLERVPFEDTSISIPAGYDEILTIYFGDYMTPPPESERVGHHFYSIVRR